MNPASSPLLGRRLRVAWFSPLPPSTSGIAAYSSELVPLLRATHDIDVFVDGVDHLPGDRLAARDFVWRARRAPYDLVVYQLGNAACHDYMWGYLFHYPGLVILHDAQLHQARAQALLTRWRPRLDDYMDEFAWNHPGAPRDLGRLVATGLGGSLYGHWPHVRLVLQAARLAAVHSPGLAADLSRDYAVDVRSVPMGVADPLDDTPEDAALVRARHGIPRDAVVVGAVGGLTPEKRLPQLLAAVAALASSHPSVHVMLVGAPATHYDVCADAARAGIADRVHVTGYVPDEALGSHLGAMDICACLRWPTNRETSASWLRAMAAGRPTIITELAHLSELPVLDPRTWLPSRVAAPVAVSVPILDEATALRAAIEGLAHHVALRHQLGTAARAYWQQHHTLATMASAYQALMLEAASRPAPTPALPSHLTARGDERLTELLGQLGVSAPALLRE